MAGFLWYSTKNWHSRTLEGKTGPSDSEPTSRVSFPFFPRFRPAFFLPFFSLLFARGNKSFRIGRVFNQCGRNTTWQGKSSSSLPLHSPHIGIEKKQGIAKIIVQNFIQSHGKFRNKVLLFPKKLTTHLQKITVPVLICFAFRIDLFFCLDFVKPFSNFSGLLDIFALFPSRFRLFFAMILKT